jgi:hypothetical protein
MVPKISKTHVHSFRILNSKLDRMYYEHTNFPSALYGEKCSESVMPASLASFPFVSAIDVNMLKLPLQWFVTLE